MHIISQDAVNKFKNLVGLKFQLYNSLFTALPFQRIEKTGMLLTLLQSSCEEGYERNEHTNDIIDGFFKRHTIIEDEKEKINLLFRFVQFAERQVVLFDSLEDAAFSQVNDMQGKGTLKQLFTELDKESTFANLEKQVNHFCVRLVLTAHPTQFYPGTVLAIINDLAKALAGNNTQLVNMYLQQLGRTAFFKKQKPTPFDEAMSLIWYLEKVFYPATGKISEFMNKQLGFITAGMDPFIAMGFWPGGDRDGNPFVTVETSLSVAEALRGSIIKCYYLDVRKIRRRLTFEGVVEPLAALEKKLYNNIFIPGHRTNLTVNELIETMEGIRQTILQQHNGLFVNLADDLISKMNIFGLHFASLDIRQHSAVHSQVLGTISLQGKNLTPGYAALSKDEKIKALEAITFNKKITGLDGIAKDTLDTILAIKDIQQFNGERGCNRYIISHCQDALDVLELHALFVLAGGDKGQIMVDFIPLLETIEDLGNAYNIMEALYRNPLYKKHLAGRRNKQTIMVGFSDGTKDGGYLMANWSIYKAKKSLSALAMQYGLEVIFFDGRGGPPARGGGKTHQFYASMGKNISGEEIQLTVQGQTVSSQYGTIDSARYNMEQLIHAGISNKFLQGQDITLPQSREDLLQQLAGIGLQHYNQLKDHPLLVDYLLEISPLRFYSETNISSRPSQRGKDQRLLLEDLRAIPFVGSWSQVKQNITGYYGVGTSLQQMEREGQFDELKGLYKDSLYFRTLLDNCEMSLLKCFFPITANLANDPKYSELWWMIKKEYDLTLHYVLKLSGHSVLMEDYPVDRLSIQMRDRIVLPLLSIQQYALSKIRSTENTGDQIALKEKYGKLAMRCSFGIINAGRNSA
ncbi:MAG: phosphoenolpyruvate carboxylase [Ferruginibacter sp.]